MATTYATILMRRGEWEALDKSKLKAGEWVVVLSGDSSNSSDGTSIYMSFGSGKIKQVCTVTEMTDFLVNMLEDIENDFAATLQEATDAANTAAAKASDATVSVEAVENDVETAEESRVAAEKERVAAEKLRVAAEEKREKDFTEAAQANADALSDFSNESESALSEVKQATTDAENAAAKVDAAAIKAETAADKANTATVAAESATVSANTAATNAGEAADKANEAAEAANASVIKDVSASSLAAGSAPTVALADNELSFGIPKGDKGEQGEKGDKGEKGDMGDPPDVSATATISNTSGVPEVTVTKSGTNAAPSFAFAFTNLKGDKGEQGEKGDTGASGDYAELDNLPTINGVILTGSQTAESLGLVSSEDLTEDIADMATKTYVQSLGYATTDSVNSQIATATTDMATKTYVQSLGYATTDSVNSQIATATTDMATKTYVQSLGYATTDSVDSKIDETANDLQEKIDAAITSAVKPKGSVAFASLPTPTKTALGDMYNITDDFTTTASFTEGAGKDYPAGSNVVCVQSGTNYLWDVQGGFIDLTPYAKTADFARITESQIETLFA